MYRRYAEDGDLMGKEGETAVFMPLLAHMNGERRSKMALAKRRRCRR
jgi:hypothetical protein